MVLNILVRTSSLYLFRCCVPNMGHLILTMIPACYALNLLQQQNNAGKHQRNPKKDSISQIWIWKIIKHPMVVKGQIKIIQWLQSLLVHYQHSSLLLHPHLFSFQKSSEKAYHILGIITLSRMVEISFLARENIKLTCLKTTKDFRSLQVYLLLVNAKEEQIIALVKKILIKLILGVTS